MVVIPENPKTFAERLMWLAKSNNAKDISEWSGLRYTTVINYLSHDRLPSAEMLITLYEHRRVNIQWLLTGVGEPYVTPERNEEKLNHVTEIESAHNHAEEPSSEEVLQPASDGRVEYLVIQIPAFEVKMTIPRDAELPDNLNVAIPLIHATKTEEKKG